MWAQLCKSIYQHLEAGTQKTSLTTPESQLFFRVQKDKNEALLNSYQLDS